MVQFTKLSMVGFKSFADPYDIDIRPGLTGVVGPNGCGKSNLVEALRWIMGENSAKRMRGAEMDDVIFAGTGSRAPRNQAEVKLVLDNHGRQAPEIFNKDDTLEISRRIDRGKGSDYRVNGKSVRARDIQMLFADTATGSSSPAIVSQGRVSDLIHAKPTDRRQILEDAAAISGINTRRKEAEQRLKSADSNLERVSDVIASKEKAYQDLRKQARQAIRYRDLSSTLRQIESVLVYREWQSSVEECKNARNLLSGTHEMLEKQKVVVFDIKKKRDALKTQVDQLQNRAIAIQTKRSGLDREKQSLQEQLAQIDKAVEQTNAQIIQIQTDISHEENVSTEASKKASLLEEEKENIKAQNSNYEQDIEKALAERDKAMAEVDIIQESLSNENSSLASQKAQLEQLRKQATELESGLEQLNNKLSTLQEERKTYQTKLEEAAPIKDMQTAVTKADKALKNAQDKAAQVERDKGELSNDVASARTHYQTLESRVTKLITETETLTTLLENYDDSGFPPILNNVNVEEGYEKALSVAMGDDLRASTNKDAPVVWNNMGWLASSLPKLPEGLANLQDFVTAPKALHATLSQIGLTDDDETAQRFVKSLKPGQ